MRVKVVASSAVALCMGALSVGAQDQWLSVQLPHRNP